MDWNRQETFFVLKSSVPTQSSQDEEKFSCPFQSTDNFPEWKLAYEHTVFWFIYERAYENPLFWCLISTLMHFVTVSSSWRLLTLFIFPYVLQARQYHC